MEEVREQMSSGPVYISFDIDALDPSFAPGTGVGFFYANVLFLSVSIICIFLYFQTTCAREPMKL